MIFESIFLVLAVCIAITAFITLAKSMYLVRQAEAIIVERFGRFDRVLTPGLHLIVPFIETPRKVRWTYVFTEGDSKRYYRATHTILRIDLREAVYDFPKQNVITKDNVTMEINALLYYQITDPKAAIYEVENLSEAIEKLTQTTLRNVIGAMDLDESLVSRDLINERLRLILDEATDKWGVKINRVELQEVNPPHDIRIAMEKQMRAERDRRAIILESEGKKRSAILEAEGLREADILQAEGEARAKIINAESDAAVRLTLAEADAQARLKMAQAEAEAIKMLQDIAPEKDAMGYLIAMRYIKSLPEIATGKNDKIVFVPYEASSVLGSLGAAKQLFNEINAKGL
jgi:regulator of protease activity HflC (stomatin/prohibitin superfamily)